MRIPIAVATALALGFAWSASFAQTDDEKNHDMKVVFKNHSGAVAYLSGEDGTNITVENEEQGEVSMTMEGCPAKNPNTNPLVTICLSEENCNDFIAVWYYGSVHSNGTCYLLYGGIDWDFAGDFQDQYTFKDKATNEAHKRDLTMTKSE